MRQFIAGLLAVGPVLCVAHVGGLNSEGCHTNHKTGDYHCHRGAVRPAQQMAPVERPQPRGFYSQQAYQPRQAPGRPTCYTGPRGGTYTITASGRKNYSGC